MEPIQIILPVIVGIVCAVVFFFVGVTYRKKVAEKEIGSAEEEAKRLINEAIKAAENKNRELLLEAKEEIHKSRTEYEKEVKERRADLQKQERRLQQKEETLDRKLDAHEKREEELNHKLQKVAAAQEETDQLKRSQMEVLEKISGLSQEEAKTYLLENVESQIRHETAMKINEVRPSSKRKPISGPVRSSPPPFSAVPPITRPKPPFPWSPCPTTI